MNKRQYTNYNQPIEPGQIWEEKTAQKRNYGRKRLVRVEWVKGEKEISNQDRKTDITPLAFSWSFEGNFGWHFSMRHMSAYTLRQRYVLVKEATA